MTIDLRQQAYDRIQGWIVSGRLAAGRQVSELSLARELRVSRTPVREAIRRLVHEGLLEQVARLGTVVRTPGRRDIVELYELREALETYAAGRAVERIGAEELAQLSRLCAEIGDLGRQLRRSKRRALDAAGLQRFLAADLAFHVMILRGAGNGRILKIVAESRVLTGIFGTPRQDHDAKVVLETHRYHRRILAALKRRDGPAARKLLAEHIRQSLAETLAHFDQPRVEAASLGPLGLPPDLLAELDRIERGPAARKRKAGA